VPTDAVLDLDEPGEPGAKPVAGSGGDEAPAWGGDELLFIDVKGNIHVRGGRFFASRVVGSVRGKDAETAMAELVARFRELEDRLGALEREIKSSRNLVRSLKSLRSFVHWAEGADAIGDFAGLLERALGRVVELEREIESRRTAKLALAARAEELAGSTQWRSSGEAFDALMEEWKRVGPTGSEEDEAVWQRFRTARKTFFDARSHHYAELKGSRNEARQAKEALIARAEELAPSTDWDTTFDAMQAMIEDWKKAGSAGRDLDDALWERFRAAREPFFAARKAHQERERSEQRARERKVPDRRRAGTGGRPRVTTAGSGGRARSSGPLHASLAEIVGPLKDLFPASRPARGEQESKPGAKGKGQRG